MGNHDVALRRPGFGDVLDNDMGNHTISLGVSAMVSVWTRRQFVSARLLELESTYYLHDWR